MVNIGSENFNRSRQKLSFGRALSQNEMPIYGQGMAEARKLLQIADTNNGNKPTGLNNTALILPDFYAPGGTLNSAKAMKFIDLIHVMTGANVVQALPRGPITKTNLSPFSSSPFELGDHLIDPEKLGAPDIETAHENFKALPANSPLKVAYKQFNEANPHLERYGMLDALAKDYGTDYSPNWQGPKAELDKNLFNYDDTKEIPAAHNVRQEEIKAKHSDIIDSYKFKQFIGNQQHAETKQELNAKGMKYFGDCLIGFSYRDNWAFKPAFESGKTLGCIGDDKQFRDWGVPCLDFNKLKKPDGSLGTAGTVLKKKFDVFFDNYDGARIDAGWQLSHPQTSKGKETLGTKMLDIMEMALKDQKDKGHHIAPEDITIETLGGPADAVLLTKNKFPHIHITRYEKDDWGRGGFYFSDRSADDHEKTNTGYRQNGLTLGLGTHDDRSLIDLSETERNSQAPFLAKDLKLDEKTLTDSGEEFRNAKFGEIFTARNQFVTANDAIGDKKRLNNPDNVLDPNNWTINAEHLGNPEEVYFKNLSEGKGLNTPKSLAIAIRAKMGENEATKGVLGFLDAAGRILRQTGPNTIAEASNLEKTDSAKLGERLVKAGETFLKTILRKSTEVHI